MRKRRGLKLRQRKERTMAIKADREYRNVQPFKAAEDGEDIVRGYATTFDEAYEMYEDWDGNKYYEKIDRHALDGADMSDVIMQYDHRGRVFARQSNGSLELTTDEHGLAIKADLSRSSGAKGLYEDIAAELITQMSWAFTVAEDAYDRDTRTRTILRVKKVYDVSAVSIPANPDTVISARNYFEGVIEAERAERLEREKRARRIKLLAQL